MAGSCCGLELANTLRDTGQWRKAADLIASIVVEQPENGDAWALLALVLPQLNRIADAEIAAQRALERDPNSPIALRALSVVYLKQQRSAEAIPLAEKAMIAAPECPYAMVTLGLARMAEQRLDEADALFQQAIAIAQLAEAYANRAVLLLRRGNLGAAIEQGEAAIGRKPFLTNVWQLLAHLYQQSGRLAEAIHAREQSVQLEPDNPALLVELGKIYCASGALQKALTTLEQAVALFPGDATAWANLGIVQQVASQNDKAQASYVQALAIDPELGDVHNNVGVLYLAAGNIGNALASFEQACRCFPARADLHANLGIAALKAGKSECAFDSIKRSLQIEELPQTKRAFVLCVKQLREIPTDDENMTLVVRAMREPWGRPTDLAIACINFLKRDPSIAFQVGRVLHSWPARLTRRDFCDDNAFAATVSNPVLRCLMETVPVFDSGLEKLLTTLRKNFLADLWSAPGIDALDASLLGFYCALARQCFINGYVFDVQDDEMEWVEKLRVRIAHAIEEAIEIPASQLVVLAAYLPLHKLPRVEVLLERSWPEPVQGVLTLQVADTLTEQRLRAGITSLTRVEDEISLLVQQQYEECPYPRWTCLPAAEGNFSIGEYLHQAFPFAPFLQTATSGQEIDILIAGCGTGQHSIETAQRFRNARVLAVDLSLASLGYAMRKSQELGLKNIEHAQADILKLNDFGRQYDVIESVGVLHHLREPEVGWRILSNLLKPGGFMRLGLYSNTARQDIVMARRFIQEREYAPIPNDIRRCRQELMSLSDTAPLKEVINRHDFYEMNSCRDLLFHCQEHRFSLPQVEKILEQLRLRFIGFIFVSPAVPEAYLSRFPQDAGMVNLKAWDVFEAENPVTFKSMYQFWVQKETG